MARIATSPRIRYCLGTLTFIIGLITAIVSIGIGLTGLSYYHGYKKLLRLGTPKVGSNVAMMLIVNGFLLDLVPALGCALLGCCIRRLLSPTIKRLKRMKGDLKGKKQRKESPVAKGRKKLKETLKKLKKGRRKGEDSQKETDRSQERDLTPEEAEDQEKSSKSKGLKKKYADKAPYCLWISLLIMAGANVGLGVTFLVLGGSDSSVGILEAMKNYGTDEEPREALDWVQSKGECCGAAKYTDWFRMKWCTDRKERLPTNELLVSINVCPNEHRGVKYDVPGSCCFPERVPCLHDALDILGIGPLHVDGCAEYVNGRLQPRFKTLGVFHMIFCLPKLILMVLVLLLRPAERANPEKSSRRETKNLLNRNGNSEDRNDNKPQIDPDEGQPKWSSFDDGGPPRPSLLQRPSQTNVYENFGQRVTTNDDPTYANVERIGDR